MINVHIHRCRFIAIHILIYLLIGDSCYSYTRQHHVDDVIAPVEQPSAVPIGVVLDTNSPMGSMLHLCIRMALSDFYAKTPNSTTVLQLHTRNAQSVVDANFAVVDLLEREQVEGIIGPQGSTQDIFISELGQRTHIPIISVTARSSSLSTAANNFFIRTTADDSIQARALAALCQGFQWPQAVLLYEDTEYGHQFQSHLTNAFRDVGIGLVHLTAIALSADANHLSKLLASLNQQETRVFLVHISPSLGFRLFKVAKNVGVMREGSAWIITDSLANFFSSMDSATRDAMEGVVGVRPYVAPSKGLRKFQERWERNSSRASMDLNVYGLWAYDTIKALAIAAENIGPAAHDVTRAISPYGSRLLRELSYTRFRGLSGYFQLVDGRLKASDFEIINLIGTGERRVGFWNPQRGITRELSSNYGNSPKELKNVVWPGDSTIKPKGWAIPPSGSLRVGVPWKPGYQQFVNAVIDPATNETLATGFAIDIFLCALKQMTFPINYTFYCYNESTSYDRMLHEIPRKYDMVVADTTIWAPRASYVDFTLPYSESGLVLVVKNNKPLNWWLFIKPLSRDLWLAIFLASVFMGISVWRLERPTQPTAPTLAGAQQDEELLVPAPAAPAPAQQDEELLVPAPAAPAPAPAPAQQEPTARLKFPIFVPVAALAFPETALVRRGTSLFVLVCWLFTAVVLMQSYTANYAAILTIDKLKFSFSDDHYIGYHDGSFAYEFLTKKLNLSPSRLKPYSSVEEYHDAMRKGSKKGGIDAIFDERPYMNLLLIRYYHRYKIVGPTFKTDGLGFALPIGSPLVAHFSRAILNVTQSPDMTALEQKNFGPGYSSQDPLQDTVSQGASSLTARDFAGLFLILGVLTISALLWTELKILDKLTRIWHRSHQWLRDYRNRGPYDPVANRENEAAAAAAGGGDRNEVNGDDAVGGGGREGNEVNEEVANAENEVGERDQNNEGHERAADANDHHLA